MAIDFRALANPGVRDLTPYQPGKPVETLERELGITSSIKLASNENPLGPPPAVKTALSQLLQNAHIYPDAEAYELKQALKKFLNVEHAQITVGNGSENILELIVRAYLQPGDHAIISQYAFMAIPLLIKSHGALAKVIPAKDWGHDIDAMLQAIDDKTRLIFLVNPNNPTGTFTDKETFEHFLKQIPPHILIVVDSAYAEYIQASHYPNAIDYLKDYPNLIVTRTFSKVFGLAGLRLGYALSSLEIADILNRVRLPFNVNAIAAKAACLALEDLDHLTKSITLNNTGKEQLEFSLQALKLNFIPSLGNFISVDVGDGIQIYEKLLREGVIVRPLKNYGMPKHIRVTIGTTQQNERFLAAIHKVRG